MASKHVPHSKCALQHDQPTCPLDFFGSQIDITDSQQYVNSSHVLGQEPEFKGVCPSALPFFPSPFPSPPPSAQATQVQFTSSSPRGWIFELRTSRSFHCIYIYIYIFIQMLDNVSLVCVVNYPTCLSFSLWNTPLICCLTSGDGYYFSRLINHNNRIKLLCAFVTLFHIATVTNSTYWLWPLLDTTSVLLGN
jgi:hypothetical protein